MCDSGRPSLPAVYVRRDSAQEQVSSYRAGVYMATIERVTNVSGGVGYAGIASVVAAPALWLFVRLILGAEWLRGAQEKIGAAGWTEPPVGGAVAGFINGALGKATGAHPEVQPWFTWFAQHVVLPHAALFANLVTWGELLAGFALIIGLCTRLTALSAAFLNFMFLAAGTTSANPQMLVLELAIVLVGSTAGTYGVDRWIMPRVTTALGWSEEGGVPSGVVAFLTLLLAVAVGFIVTDSGTWLGALLLAVVIGVVMRSRSGPSGLRR